MDAYVELSAEADETTAETAAPRGAASGSYKTPLDMVKKALYGVVINTHALFRLSVLGSLLNDEMFGKFQTTNIGGVINYDLSDYTKELTANSLRDRMNVNAGDGGKKPIIVSFYDSLQNIPDETVDEILSTLPARVKEKSGMNFVQFLSELEGKSVAPSVAAVLSPAIETNTEIYFDFLKDFVEFKIYAEKVPFNEGNSTSSIEFKFAIELDGTLYNEIVDADAFSPYLVYLWVNNSLMNTPRRGVKIIDPRKVAKHKNDTLKLGSIRPKVNAQGFCIHGSGIPMYIPPDLDRVEEYMKTANSCIDEDGNFQRNDLVEKHNLDNYLIYVDWVNDILAYTSPTGILNTFNLGNVAPLDQATEWGFLNTPLYHPNVQRMMRVIQESLNALENPSEAEKYVTSTTAKKILQEETPAQIYQGVVIRASSGANQDVSFADLCGYRIESKYEEYPELIGRVRALNALFKHLSVVMKSNRDALKIPGNMAHMGILNRLIGIEYVIQAVTKYTADDVKSRHDAYNTENEKKRIDYNVKEFDIPNIMVTDEPGRGLTGLLPHQGRIMSSLMHSPLQSVKNVATGGGKTALSLLQAIYGIVNLRTIPMIMTKTRLIKGTVTEINSMCQGKMNAMPFTPIILRRLARRAGIKTFAQFLTWYKALPPNTILISSYTATASRRKIYEDLSVIEGFGDAPIYTTQFLLIIKLLGIRMVDGDESTMVKNPDSARARNSYAVFSHADSRSVASGTLVSNTVNDLVGQARAISPYIFGDNAEQFANTYNISMGIINDESAKIIKDRLRGTTAYYEASQEDWSYMLPIKEDEIRFARMTELQSEFYDILMNEALLMMLEDEKNKGKKKKAVSEDDEDDEDDEEDDEDEDDDEDAEENAFIAKAKVYLQNVEAFLVAPDENEQYVRWEKKPQGDDLVSPKVRLADRLIEEHLSKHSGNLKQNKIIIFGWNRVASQHFMRHSKYARQTLHYTAGEEEVVRRFANDDNVYLMCADETALREGENLQMVSLILRQQSVWAPGDHEQAVARMYRPDPRGRYNRDTVNHIWMMNEKYNGGLTLDGSKMARLTSKFVSNARFKYEGRTEWKRVSAEFDDLKMIKMNLKLLFYTPKEDMIPYWGSWKTFTEWEAQLNTAAKFRMARDLEARTGEDLIDTNGKIRDINQFIRLAMYQVKSTKDIPGSRRVFMPLIQNALPPDPDNWGFKVMGQQDVPVGTVVYTEFGPGIMVAVTKRGARVQLHDGSKIGFKKGDILLVNPKRYKEFAEIVKNPTRWRAESFSPFGKGKTAKPAPVADEEEVIESLDEEEIIDDENNEEIDVITGIINGWPSLLIMQDLPALKRIKGWNRIDPFVSVGFRNWSIAEKFLDAIDGKMAIPDKVYEALQEEMKQIREGKAMHLGTQINMSSFRDFFRTQHKKLGRDKNQRIVLHPYWMATERDIKLAFDINSHDPKFVSWLIRQGTQQPALKVKRNDAFWLNTFTSVREAINDIENLRQLGTIDEAGIKEDLADVKKAIQLLRRPRSRPSL